MDEFLIVWWLDNKCYYASFETFDEADSAARVRNALLVNLRGDEENNILDYYRRDENGTPMPGVKRDIPPTFSLQTVRE